MKKRVFFLLLFSIIFMGMCNEVNALEKIATCSYSVKDVQDFEIEIYNNKIEHPDNDLVPGKSIMFMYSFKEKEYLNKVYDGNKLAAQCPTLAYCTDASGNYIIQAENTICAAGGDSTSISGTMKIEKNDVEVKEDKSRTVCTRYSTPRGGKKLEIKFGYNADGEKNFSVYWEGTTTGASALYDASIVVSNVIYSVDEEVYDVFWDENSCESSDLYFENQGAETSGTKHYIITNKKSSGLNNGSNDNSTGHEEKTPSSSDIINQPFNPKQLCEEAENCDISLANFCTSPAVARTFKFLGLLFYIAKILVPGIIIIMGFVNLFKIMTSGKTDDAKKYAKSIIIRIFVGIAIFLLPGIINTIYDAAKSIIGSGDTGGFDNCATCLLDPNSDKCYIEEN